MTQALVVGGFGQEAERIMQKGISGGVFSQEELARAKRTQEAAKRRADQERLALPKAGSQLAAAKTGEQIEKVGELYFSAGDWARAATTLQKAIAKGGVEDPDRAHMLLGVALKRKGDKAGAMKAFDAVKEPKFAAVAKLWKTAAR
jgi:Flp pilus assembly protein TadD